MQYGPGSNLTYNNRFAQMLQAQDKAAGVDGRAVESGLAHALRQGLAGYMMGVDQKESTLANKAFMEGLEGTTETVNAPVDDELGEETGYMPTEVKTGGGIQGALSSLRALPTSNEYAGNLARQLMTQQLAMDQAAKLKASDRAHAAKLLEQQRMHDEGVRSTARYQAIEDLDRKEAAAIKLKGTPGPGALTSNQKDYEYAVRTGGYTGTFNDFILGKNMARSGSIYTPPKRGAAPAGSPPSVGVATPVPGSPAAIAASELDLKQRKEEEKKKALDKKAALRKEGRSRAGGTVIQDIGRAMHLVKTNWSASGVPAIVGTLLPKSMSSASEAQSFVESALSNVGLDTLQAMRESSPTGGALGQVPIQQQKRLEQVLGSLDVTQREDVVLDNLKRVQNIYMDIVHGTPEQISKNLAEGKIDAATAKEISHRHSLSFDSMGTPKAGQVTESAIQFTMKKHGMTRDEVISRLKKEGRL